MTERNSGETILAFLLGGLLGATLGILFAPKSGKETRAQLKILAEDLGEKAGDLIEEGKDRVGNLVAEAKEKFAHKH
jgi:gas vesicle protein